MNEVPKCPKGSLRVQRVLNGLKGSDAFIGRKLKQISFVLVLIFKKQIGLICFSFHPKKLNTV